MSDLPDIDEFLTRHLDQWAERSLEQHNRFTLTLRKFGPEALEPLLKAFDRAHHESLRWAILEAMTSLGIHDPRIEEHLLALLDTDPMLAAMLLPGYEDRALLPQMKARLAALETGPGDDLTDDTIRELHRAIDELEADHIDHDDPDLSPAELLRKREELERENAILRRQLEYLGEPFRKGQSQKLGRNDPCWCGSGVKYKRCHMREDDG